MEIQKNNSHTKQSFQVDRIAFFSDAVFAIVITLLIIEFKTPHITANTTKEEAVNQLLDLKFNFIAVLISFFIVAQQWFQHHLFFKYVHNYNNQILKTSIFILLPIIFYPFSTAFFADSTISEKAFAIGFRIFTINMFASTAGSLYFYYITFVKSKDCTYTIPKKEREKFISGSIFSLVFCLIMFFATFIFDNYNYILLSIVVASLPRLLIRKLVSRKYKSEL